MTWWPMTCTVSGCIWLRGEREGRRLEDREVLVFHIRDGQVAEVWQYIEDQYTYDEFFS
jgi:ketosteroid isomerase-like protein